MTQRVGIPMAGQVAGDVFASFQRLNNIISKNDGIRSFSVLTNNCYDSDQGFDDSLQTHIRITNTLHDINQIDQTYLRMTFEAQCQFSKDITGAANAIGHTAFFLGWKNANECLKQLEVDNMNIETNYLQTECAKEGFCYSTYKPREEKQSRKYVHSRFDDVVNCRDGVCGTYFGFKTTLTDSNDLDNMSGASIDTNVLKAGTPFTVKNIQIILPITDILAFQCFEDWPGGLGDIVLKIFFNHESMVWAQCDPSIVSKAKQFEFGKPNAAAADLFDQNLIYDHRFVQVGTDKSDYVKSYTATGYEVSDATKASLTINSLKCVRCQCECYGYNVTSECKRQLVSLFTPSNPYIIPAQQIDVKQFANSIQSDGHYDSDFTYALHNVTDFVIVFPDGPTNVTTFKNPMATNVQLRVDGKLYPSQSFESTYDHRFYTAMMNASDLQNFFDADDEYRNSLLTERKLSDSLFPHDVTSFIMTMQAERNSNGFFFDGLETGNQNVNISLRFNSKFASAAPQIWFTRDTYWTVDNENGLRYWKVGTPATFASAEDATLP